MNENDAIIMYSDLTEKQIRQQSTLDWIHVSCYSQLSEQFIREFSNKVDWQCISYKQILSEPFIRKFSNKVDWHLICENQVLSEFFLEEFKEKINTFTFAICCYQKLTENFILNNW